MKRLLSQSILGVAFILAAGIIALRVAPKPMLLDGVKFSSVVYDRHGQIMRFALAADDTYRHYVPLEQISPLLVDSTLLYEDRYFYQHAGANPVALGKALWNEVAGSQRRLGASTITMQVARMRYRLNSRTWGGKLRQILLAARMECHYSKRQILEAYFNLAPYGRNIEGIGAAARIYFDKEPDSLTLAEALTLSVIPQNPTRRAPSEKNTAVLMAARQLLFNAWIELHPADAVKRSTLEMPIQIRTLTTLPFAAPHFSEELLQTPQQSKGRLTTTIDLSLQELLEKQIGGFVRERKRQGLNNAVALLIDYQTMEVLASVGSAGFFDTPINGQVNGATMKRSPGSALKPFVYALALDQGIIQPHSLLKDAPTSFNGYNPENFDRDFMGPVQACDALVQSRNIPAVTLASKLKEHTLYNLLQQAQVTDLRPETTYGLTIPLGGVEISPEELARLYAMLANRGHYRPLSKRLDESPAPDRHLLSPEASFLVLDMLKKNALPGSTTSGSRPIAWKTGTSYSFRDAWTAGVFDHYVLVTWVGHFDGRPNPALIGRSAAAPLFFSIVNAIRAQTSAPTTTATWESVDGLKLAAVDLCAVTGELASPLCTHRKKGWFIPGVSPLTTCQIHQEILIDPRTGFRVARLDAANGARREIWEIWPSELMALFQYAGLPRRTPPPFAPEQTSSTATGQPTLEITSPRMGLEYHLRLTAQNQTVPLQANAPSNTQYIYWFADKTFLGSSAPGETLLWQASTGKYQISAVDNLGRSATRHLVVAANR